MNFQIKFLEVVRGAIKAVHGRHNLRDVEKHGQFVVDVTEAVKAKILPDFPNAQVSATTYGSLLAITGDEAGLKKNDNFIVEYIIKPDGVLKFKGSRDGARS